MIKPYAIHWLSKLSGIYKMELNVFGMPDYEPPARALTQLSAFYRQIYNDWRIAEGGRNFQQPKTYKEHLNEPLWGNPMLSTKKRSGKGLYYACMARAGYTCVRDIYARRPSSMTLSFQVHPIIYHLIPIEWQKLPPAQALHPSPHQQIYNQMCMMKGEEEPLYVRDITTNHLYRCLVEKI